MLDRQSSQVLVGLTLCRHCDRYSAHWAPRRPFTLRDEGPSSSEPRGALTSSLPNESA